MRKIAECGRHAGRHRRPVAVREMARAGRERSSSDRRSTTRTWQRRASATPRAEEYGGQARLFHEHGIQVNGSFVVGGFDGDWCDTFVMPGRTDTAHVVRKPEHLTPDELLLGYDWLYRRLFSLDLGPPARGAVGHLCHCLHFRGRLPLQALEPALAVSDRASPGSRRVASPDRTRPVPPSRSTRRSDFQGGTSGRPRRASAWRARPFGPSILNSQFSIFNSQF